MQNNQHLDEDEKPVEIKVYTQQDLLQFQNANMYSSIGRMVLSSMTSAPTVGFGTADRKKQAKIFQSKELCKTQFIGKTSPGPNYEVRDSDKYYYIEDPKWSFSKSVRNTLDTGAKHAYYNRQDIDFDPIQADNTRRWKSGNVKIGLESRFNDAPKKNKATPGPEYTPGFKPDLPSPVTFSFGQRREVKGASPLVAMASTPNQVGPGSYFRFDQQNTSLMPDHPKFSFPKDPKHKPANPSVVKNATFDTRSCFGTQVCSHNKNQAVISFKKAKRDVNTGMFKDTMSTQPTRLRIEMPKRF